MIQKIYRLKEKEMKKVLAKWKPFFSYMIVLNKMPNNETYHRFGIIISQKSISNSVNRNFFRRLFYNIIRLQNMCSSQKNTWETQENKYFDYVYVVKKQISLDKKNIQTTDEFQKNLHFLFTKA
jgi:ribonuclease P protein component